MTRLLVGALTLLAVAGATEAAPGLAFAPVTQVPGCADDVTVVLDLAMTGSGSVMGMNLYLEVAAPLEIVGLDLTDADTVFGPSHADPFIDLWPTGTAPNPQYAVGYVVAWPGTVSAPGIAAKVTVKVPSGTSPADYAITTYLTGSFNNSSDWAGLSPDTQGDGVVRVGIAIPGDCDCDGDVDGNDRDTFESCASGPGVAWTGDCLKADFDSDSDVDQRDFAVFQRCYSGENIPADPSCAN
jgi:hypothetical protein